jgi:DNA-binding CsgD family transcriptional regulator
MEHIAQRCFGINNTTRETKLLTKREREIMQWLKQGKSTWEISQILCISERTVKFHINNVITKLDAVNRTHAVAIAIEKKLV